MIPEFIAAFDAGREALRTRFAASHPQSYDDIVRAVVETVSADKAQYDRPDPDRIHSINDGDYQGTLVFVIGGAGYQPSAYWYVRVSYGSCSGCDTLEAIRSYSGEAPTAEQVNDYMTLALHIVQQIRQMGGETA